MKIKTVEYRYIGDLYRGRDKIKVEVCKGPRGSAIFRASNGIWIKEYSSYEALIWDLDGRK